MCERVPANPTTTFAASTCAALIARPPNDSECWSRITLVLTAVSLDTAVGFRSCVYHLKFMAILRWLWFFVLWIAAFVAVAALSNWVFGLHRPLWDAAVQGVVMGVVMILFFEGQRRGWIKGVLWNPDSHKRLEQRRRDLADTRERIIAESEAGHDA